MVLELFENRTISSSHFTKSESSCRLKKEAFSIFIEKYSEVAQQVLDLLWNTLMSIMEVVNEAGSV